MTPERDLWIAVIARAVLDAVSPSQAEEGRRARVSARRFFEYGGADFNQTCSLAGLDPDAVREAYLAGRFEMCAQDLQCLFRTSGGRVEKAFQKGSAV